MHTPQILNLLSGLHELFLFNSSQSDYLFTLSQKRKKKPQIELTEAVTFTMNNMATSLICHYESVLKNTSDAIPSYSVSAFMICTSHSR